LIVGLVVVASVLIARNMSAPIVRLTGVAEQVSGGDLSARAQVETNDEIGTLAKTFNAMTAELQDTLLGLERRVEDRTRAIEVSSEVSRRLSTILNVQELVEAVVSEVQQAFGYYHAHIYLVDEKGQNLVMVGGTGEAGQMMLARKHTIPMGRGLVGRAALTGQVILVPDTAQEPGWLPNPLLPETKSEISVPILLGKKVLGVLDVQQDTINGLSSEDSVLLQSIANQVAVAVQNANLYASVQQKAEREALLNRIAQQIQTATTIEGVLQIASHELGFSLGAQRASIQVGGEIFRGDGSKEQ
jgi:nitrate/nitrite-specific signal transduction histidine kinase